jgi:uncharacterized OB-fold protein
VTGARRPARTLGGEHDEFWAWCARDVLALQRCEQCEHFQWPPVPSCTDCGSMDLEWTEVSGRATVRSKCVYEREYFPECPTPWPVIIVELDEGPLFVSNSLDLVVEDLGDGVRVEVTFIDGEDAAGAFRLPVFGPAGSEPSR